VNTALDSFSLKSQSCLKNQIFNTGFNFNIKDGNTPLHAACASENSSGALIVVQTILDADADLSSVNNARNSAFHIACHNGNHQILEFLLTQEYDTDIYDLRNSHHQVTSFRSRVTRLGENYVIRLLT